MNKQQTTVKVKYKHNKTMKQKTTKQKPEASSIEIGTELFKSGKAFAKVVHVNKNYVWYELPDGTVKKRFPIGQAKQLVKGYVKPLRSYEKKAIEQTKKQEAKQATKAVTKSANKAAAVKKKTTTKTK